MFMLRLITRVWRRAAQWRRGRRWVLFLQGLPALAAAGAVLTPLLGAAFGSSQELESRYLEQGKAAFKAKDYAGALTCYDRLAYRGLERPEVLYGLAVSAEALGQSGRAEAIMNALAPPDQPGYARAHYWLALHVPAAADPDGARAAREAAESHLLRALDGELDDREAADFLLGKLYLDDAQYLAARRADPGPCYDDAELHLARAVKAKPQLRMELAQLYKLRGDADRARTEAQMAVSYFRARSMADLEDRRARLGWADATAFLDDLAGRDDFPGAVAILQEGLNVSDDRDYRAAIGSVYVLWSEAAARDPKAKPGDQLGAGGSRACAAIPAPTTCSTACWPGGQGRRPAGRPGAGSLSRNFSPPARRPPVRISRSVWMLHSAARPTRPECTPSAPTSWRPRRRRSPITWRGCWPRPSPPDLDRALELSNLAVGQSPKDLSFRDTRGRIFMKLGRWKEALADLEALLPGNPDNADLHKALAEVYDNLRLPEMAAEHRRLAEKKPAREGQAGPVDPPAPTPDRGAAMSTTQLEAAPAAGRPAPSAPRTVRPWGRPWSSGRSLPPTCPSS